ncbi:MAG: TIGR02117 family protein [Gammaproteobacteria bacterium]|nr:TIGR02117 family protein [Gammaproteobacteria bacterium]
MSLLKRIIKWTGFAALVPLFALLCYGALAFVLMLFPVAPVKQSEPVFIDAFVISNGVHLDFVFPAASEVADWTQVFPMADFPHLQAPLPLIAIGWGDRAFYLHTPHWRDLTLERVVGALFGGNESAVHVTYLREGWLTERTWRLPLTRSQYRMLADYVRAQLKMDGPRARQVVGYAYGRADAFYEAYGSYDIATTCNTWLGDGLRQAGLSVSRWTPFAQNVTASLEKLGKLEE